MQSLAEDRGGGAFAGDLVGITLDAAVIHHTGRCFRRVEMQIVVRGCHLLRHLAMHRGYAVQRKKPAAERLHQPGQLVGIAADNTFIGSVDDQKIGTGELRQRRPDRLFRGRDDSEAPVHGRAFFQTPGLPGRAALAGQIAGKQGRVLHAAIHTIPVMPRPLGKEPRRLTKAVAYDSGRVDAEALHQIADGAAGGHLAENHGPMIVIDPG